MDKIKILISDPISERGIESLRQDSRFDIQVHTGLSEPELAPHLADAQGLIVRSQTKVTPQLLEAAPRLRVIGRAGVGVDNIDIPAATGRGIIVMNTPGGNTISTAEHTLSLLLSLARNIPQAHASVCAGRWDRKKFQGVELYDKTLVILGMGRIGSEIARRAMAFGMRVLVYDPYLSNAKARSLQVELYDSIDEVIALADFITLHMPHNKETHHMLNAQRLGKLKKGVRIINCARGGLVDESALLQAMEEGIVAGAALDVYETEPPPSDSPLFSNPHLVLTPHLGASTSEAQENVGLEIVDTVRHYLLEGAVSNAVNMPSIDAKTYAQIGPYMEFAQQLGKVLSQIAPHRSERFRIQYAGKVADLDTSLVSRSALTGFLNHAFTEPVNPINALQFADKIGLRFTETHLAETSDYADLVQVSASNDTETATVAGTFYGTRPRIVIINEHHVETVPQGVILLVTNRDIPGMMGRIGTLLGEKKVNIAQMTLSRNQIGGMALTTFNLDSEPSKEDIAEMLELEGIESVKVISL